MQPSVQADLEQAKHEIAQVTAQAQETAALHSQAEERVSLLEEELQTLRSSAEAATERAQTAEAQGTSPAATSC